MRPTSTAIALITRVAGTALIAVATYCGLHAQAPLASVNADASSSTTSTGTTTTSGNGGAANADFDSLIDLIQATVANESWADTGGGSAEIRPFPTGVMVDAVGSLKLVKAEAPTTDLAQRRGAAPSTEATKTADPHRESKLRYISLPRLEREIVRRQDAHLALDATMLTLAGLQRIRYIFVYPESHDLVLAGPAGDWKVAPFGRVVSAKNGQPIVRLDDMLVVFRRGRQSPESYFGCAINPRQEALAATQAYLDKTKATPLEPSRRNVWLEKIRSTMGQQDIDIFGIDPSSRVARVLVEADVHMKLIGMGLADGVDGVESYLQSVKSAGGQMSAMSVLRWWFTLNYSAVRTSTAGDAYELVGQGVRVLSENEMLAAQGQRVHTGQSDPLNQKFADSFTAHFAELADKYPVYGELRNIFDLALTAALIQTDHLADRAGWEPQRLGDPERLHLPKWPVPKAVDTVANCIEVNRRQIVAGVSGGVMVATADVVAKPRETAAQGELLKQRREAPAVAEDSTAWWWDAE